MGKARRFGQQQAYCCRSSKRYCKTPAKIFDNGWPAQIYQSNDWQRMVILTKRLAALLVLLFIFPFASATAAVKDRPLDSSLNSLVALGERLYKTGIGTSGEPVAAIDISGQRVFAPQFHCMACHRTSGYGSKEGGVYIPPIVAKVLYKPMKPDRARAFNGMYFQEQNAEMAARINSARTRPAYDLASLARVLRTGVDAAGEPIPHAMPRFEVSDRDVEALDAWLHTLSLTPDPGVDDTTMHFAVIVSDRTPELTRKAVLETSRVFFERMNKNIAGDRSRPNFSPLFRSEFASFWRDWSLHVWTLKGEESTWPQQLADHYAATPVFAVIGGAVAAPWQPISDFCDRQKLPCLFPLSDLPSAETIATSYTLYSYGGLPLEAKAMAQFLGADPALRNVVQLSIEGPRGSIPATIFDLEMRQFTLAKDVSTISVAPNAWVRALEQASGIVGTKGALVLWPGDDAQAAVAALAKTAPTNHRIFLASQAEPFAVTQLMGTALAQRLRIMHPTELPSVVNPHSYRVRSWLNARQVTVDPPEEQFQVYYALSVLEKAVMEIQGDYSRDYLIEQIEMIAESNLNPGVYPSLSLGPGQRVASRGSYVVKLDGAAVGGVSPDGDWIVP